MSNRYLAQPPLPLERKHWWKQARAVGTRFIEILWHIVRPFEELPREPPSFSDSNPEIDPALVTQCQWIFDQAEARRAVLEKKAQATFGLMMLLGTVVSSLFVFLSSRMGASASATRVFVVVAVAISGILLLLGFVSALRAVGIKQSQALAAASVLGTTHEFRAYNRAFHARGLLYCAAMNQALNDHLAEFVKGAHVLSAGSVATVALAAVVSGMGLIVQPRQPQDPLLLQAVQTMDSRLDGLSDEVRVVKSEIERLALDEAPIDSLGQVERRISTLESRLQALRVARSARAVPQGQQETSWETDESVTERSAPAMEPPTTIDLVAPTTEPQP